MVPRPSRRQRYCGHSCAFAVIGPKVRAAANTPEARRKLGDTLRKRGKGGGYVKRGGRHEHRVVAEEILGRRLAPREIAFHRDGAKDNNAPGNIAIAAIRGEFARAAMIGMKRRPVMTCKRGHPLEGANLRVKPNGRRMCVICFREYHRRYQQSKRDRARLSADRSA